MKRTTIARIFRFFLLMLFAVGSDDCHVLADDGDIASPCEIVMPERGICAHRGASVTHPENTLAAFREAVQLGAHQIEFDVHVTKDGHGVILHDATVDRTTNGTGAVNSLTMDEIKQLDAGSWKDSAFASESVPTLEETLAMMPVNIWLNVHVKGDSELVIMVTKEIVRQNRTHQAFLAVDHTTADAAKAVCPDIMICNMEGRRDHPTYCASTITRQAEFLQFAKALASPADMAKLKESGVRINYFYANNSEQLATLFKAGVDFPLVNDLRPMLEAAKALGIPPWKPVYRE